jgi:hypothetical protein
VRIANIQRATAALPGEEARRRWREAEKRRVYEPMAVALDYIRWCHRRGIGTVEVFHALGEEPPRRNPTWDETAELVARVWLTLSHYPVETERPPKRAPADSDVAAGLAEA